MELNPGGPVADILDRRTERQTLEQAIREGRDVLVYGPRRLGKTSLILHAAQRLQDERLVFHVDCTRKATDAEVAQVLVAQLSGLAGRWARFWDWVREHLEATSTRVVQDGTTTRIELDASRRSGRSLPDAVDLIGRVAGRAGRKALIVLDEWQYPMQRGGDALLWQMRSVSQAHPGMQLVFSGSEPTILKRMVDSESRAYWQGLVRLPVRGLGVDDVLDDLPSLGIDLDPAAADVLRDAAGTTTLRLVEVLHRLEGVGPVDAAAARNAVEAIVQLHTPDFEDILAQVKPGPQRRLLLGLARDRPAHPTGHVFIQAHDLRAAGSVTRAMERLRQLGVLDEDGAFIDALFRWYLASNADDVGVATGKES